MTVGLFLLARGFLYLWKMGDVERLLGIIFAGCFILNLATSMLTIGDPRFRIPTMGMSLALQAFGILVVLKRMPQIRGQSKVLTPWPLITNTNLKGEGS
jgi:uncharacterized membrane protein YjjP (DUF1212 family)